MTTLDTKHLVFGKYLKKRWGCIGQYKATHLHKLLSYWRK